MVWLTLVGTPQPQISTTSYCSDVAVTAPDRLLCDGGTKGDQIPLGDWRQMNAVDIAAEEAYSEGYSAGEGAGYSSGYIDGWSDGAASQEPFVDDEACDTGESYWAGVCE